MIRLLGIVAMYVTTLTTTGAALVASSLWLVGLL